MEEEEEESTTATGDFTSSSYRDNYRTNLAIFKGLDRPTGDQITISSRKIAKREIERTPGSLKTTIPDVRDEVHGDPSASAGRCCRFDGSGKYFLKQSLYGTVRMYSLSRSFATAFNPKSWAGVHSLPRKTMDDAEEEEEEEEKEEEEERNEKGRHAEGWKDGVEKDAEDEGIFFGRKGPAVGSNSSNYHHHHHGGEFHTIKHNPSYVSDNEDDETDARVGPRSGDGSLCDSRLSMATSDYDSISTGSNTSSAEIVDGARAASDIRPEENRRQTATRDEPRVAFDKCNLNESPDEENSKNNNFLPTTRQQSQAIADQSESSVSTADVDSALKFPTYTNSLPVAETIEAERQKQTAAVNPAPEVVTRDLSPAGSEKGQSKVTERESLTIIRQKARSSLICRRRERLTSKAEDVAKECRRQKNDSFQLTADKSGEVRKTLENLIPCHADISTLVRSKSFLDGVKQSVKVERREAEIRVVEKTCLSSSATEKGDVCCNGSDVILTTEPPITGLTTREYSEIFMDLEVFQVEIRNVVCSETVSEAEQLPGNFYGDHPSGWTSGGADLDGDPGNALQSNVSKVFKSKTVLLFRSTAIDMCFTAERKLLFRQLAERFSTDRPEVEGRGSMVVEEGGGRLVLSVEQFSMLCQKIKDLAQMEDKKSLNY